MNKIFQNRLAIIALALVVIMFAVYMVFTIQGSRAGQSSVDLQVSPTDATVAVDGHGSDSPGVISLSPGKHTLTISRQNFISQTISVNVTAGQETNQSVVLLAANDAGKQFIATNPDEEKQSETVTGQIIQQGSATTSADNPLIALLPYDGANFEIDSGISQAHPSDPYDVGIYITADTPTARAAAVNWIKAQGFNPNAYELIYQTYAQANAQ